MKIKKYINLKLAQFKQWILSIVLVRFIIKAVCYWMIFANDFMSDINTPHDEDGIHFNGLGYLFYKRKIYWNNILNAL